MSKPSNKLFYYILSSTLIVNILATLPLYIYYYNELENQHQYETSLTIDYLNNIANNQRIPATKKLAILKEIDAKFNSVQECYDFNSYIIDGVISFEENEGKSVENIADSSCISSKL